MKLYDTANSIVTAWLPIRKMIYNIYLNLITFPKSINIYFVCIFPNSCKTKQFTNLFK